MRLFRKINKSIWHINYYIVVFIGFAIYITFIAEHNYMRIIEYDREIKELNSQVEATQDSFKLYSQKLSELNTDRETLERIVREEYHMKRDAEDVYIVKEK